MGVHHEWWLENKEQINECQPNRELEKCSLAVQNLDLSTGWSADDQSDSADVLSAKFSFQENVLMLSDCLHKDTMSTFISQLGNVIIYKLQVTYINIYI